MFAAYTSNYERNKPSQKTLFAITNNIPIGQRLLGICIFLFGKFEETEIKLLLTTLSIGGCSLTGLCCATIYIIDKYKTFSAAGMVTAGLCFIVILFTIWGGIENIESTWKLLLSLIVLSVSLAHISLLLNIPLVNEMVESIRTVTIVFIATVAVMLVTLIFGEFDSQELFYRLLGTFAILDILGSIITPVLNKIQK
jgi:hypothetical protein